MHKTTAVIIGAGQAGLAMSWYLRSHDVDHVVLERTSVASAWENERWDSLRLLTPNWLSRLPGAPYDGEDPDGYMSAREVVSLLRRYGAAAPVRLGADVAAVRTTMTGFEVCVGEETWTSSAVVIATGACSRPFVPKLSQSFPASTHQLTPIEYRNPSQLPEGPVLVVGAGASGAQLADELARSGREVTLAVGRHRRMIRRYRGRDIFWWMDRIGMLDDVPDPLNVEGERRLPSLQLIGTPERADLDLESLANNGVRLVGRIESISGSVASLGTSVPVDSRNADLELDAVLNRIDRFIEEHGIEAEPAPAQRPSPVAIPEMPEQIEIDDFTAVIWATGFEPHYPWLEEDLLDRRGGIVHDRGVMTRPGMFVLGQPFGRRRRSSFIDGAGPDAHDLAELLVTHVNGRA